MKWILKHIRLLVIILVVAVTAVIVGVVMLNSYNSYKNYEKKYYQNDLDVRSAAAAAPKVTEINDNFKSKYKLTFEINPDDYLKDGNINANLNLAEKSFADIDVVFDCEATDNLLANMNIKVNNSLIEEDGIKVANEERHHLVMSNFALPKGDLTVAIEKVSGKTMPDIKSITLFTNEAVSA